MDHNKEIQKKIEQLRNDYKIVFGSDEAKSVMDDLEKRCFYNVTTFAKGDTNETAFFEGQRTVLLFIKSMINHKE